jgi:dihydrofolate reductase
VLVVGRKTLESLPRSMRTPSSTFERPFVVLSRRPYAGYGLLPDSAYWYHTRPATPQDVIRTAMAAWPNKDVSVIGGLQVYEFMRPVVDKAVYTVIHPLVDPVYGDTRAPYQDIHRQGPCSGRQIDGDSQVLFCHHTIENFQETT